MAITRRQVLFLLVLLISVASVCSFHQGASPTVHIRRQSPTSTAYRVPSFSTGTARKAALLVDALAAVDTFYKTAPYAAAAITVGAKSSVADIVAQKRDSGSKSKNKIELKRNFAYFAYGAMYLGVAQEYIFNHLYPSWFGTKTSLGAVFIKVLFDLVIHSTLVCLPTAYLTKAIIYKQSFKQALLKYWSDVCQHGLLTKYYKLWGPVQCLTFSVVPEHLRVSFIAVISFFWLILLSSITSRATVAKEEKGEACVNVDGTVSECPVAE